MFDTDDHPLGLHAVINSNTFFKKFRVGGNVKRYITACLLKLLLYGSLDHITGSHRNG